MVAERASELFAEGQRTGQVVRPKVLCPIVEALAPEGHGTKRVCRILGVPFATSYHWRNPPVTARAIRRAWLTDVICEIHARSRQTYGMRRIRAELADVYGHIANKKLISSIMRSEQIAGLAARRRRRSGPGHRPTNEDLVNRDFRRDGPNQLWMTDITEHPTREGKLYCCVGPGCMEPSRRRLVDRSATDCSESQLCARDGDRCASPARRRHGT